MRYICVAPDKENFNIYGESLGMEGERALYYSTGVGRGRIYRSSYPTPHEKSFKIFSYKSKNRAQTLCDFINGVYNDDFKVVEVTE
jgi:hypothetical protein